MRSGRVVLLLIASVLMAGLSPTHATAEKRIGILFSSEQPRYEESQKGIMDQLKEEGFGESIVKYTVENAKGSKARAVELAQRFAEGRMDLIFTIGTPATTVAAMMIKDVPIVFSMVYDPVDAGIAKDWVSSGNNTTGSITKFPMATVIQSLKSLAPVKRLAVLYTPGERNSETQLIELQKIQERLQIKVTPLILTNREEAALVVEEAARTIDALYLTGSTIVSDAVPAIVGAANKAKVITLSHLDDLVERGALFGVAVNSYMVGRLAGKKAVKIMRGAKPSSVPIEVEEKLDIILNMKTAKAGQFRLPPSFMKTVTRTVE